MPFTITPEALRRATDVTLERSATRLNIRRDQITEQTRAEVGETVKKALQQQFTATVDDVVRESMLEVVRTPEQTALLGNRLQAKLAVGQQIAQIVSADQQFQDILRKNAQMQKAKFDAYVTAGFTEEQAFRLLEAEVLGKAGAKAQR